MPSLKAIRKRIVSVKNTRKITRAMKLVAAAKLRRAQDAIIAARPYSKALANVVSEEENVKSVVSKVQLGEADAGIVYHSDVTPAVARYVRVFEVPDSANVIASYPMALVRGGTAPEAAKAFMELVLSAEGQRVLERHGLMPVAASNP